MTKKLSHRVTTRQNLFALTFLLFISSLLFSQVSSAVPAFARQTDMACNSCHFQSFPALNSFGRVFRAGGYTLPGSQKKLKVITSFPCQVF